jgi:hypothetical protein
MRSSAVFTRWPTPMPLLSRGRWQGASLVLSVKLSRKGWRRAQRARRDAVLIAKVARSGRVGAADQRLGTHSGCTSRANQPRRPVGGRRRFGRCGWCRRDRWLSWRWADERKYVDRKVTPAGAPIRPRRA